MLYDSSILFADRVRSLQSGALRCELLTMESCRQKPLCSAMLKSLRSMQTSARLPGWFL